MPTSTNVAAHSAPLLSTQSEAAAANGVATQGFSSRIYRSLFSARPRRQPPSTASTGSDWPRQLPPALFAHIVHFLPFDAALFRLQCVCRSFPPLSSACFRGCQAPAAQLIRAPDHVLRQLLCDIGSVCCLSLTESIAVLRRSLALSLQPPFSTLRELSVSLSLSSRIDESTFAALLSPIPCSFPRLQSLDIHISHNQAAAVALQDYDAEPIARLDQLRSLTLAGFRLTAPALLCLCSMQQLTTLHLGGCTLADEAGIAPAHYDVADVRPAWSTLVLPRYTGGKLPVVLTRAPVRVSGADDAVACIDWLLRSGAAGQDGPESSDGLSFLWYCRWPSTRLLSQLHSLTSLGLHLCSAETTENDLSDLSSFLPPHRPEPCLPHLRHLAVTWEGLTAEWPLPVYIRLLSAYSPQLASLDLKLPRLLPWADLVDALLACRQLRRLGLHGYSPSDVTDAVSTDAVRREDGHQRSPAQPRPRLALLHTLHVDSICMLDAQLADLLSCCPALEDVVLRELNSLSIGVLPEIGACCPRLRRLRLHLHNVAFLSGRHPTQPPAWQPSAPSTPPPLVPPFSSLSILSLVCSDPRGFFFWPHTIIWLVDALQSAPRLRFLRLDVDMPLHQMRVFSSFPRLAALRVWRESQPHRSLRPFFTASLPAQRNQPRRRLGQPQHRDPHDSGRPMTALSALELGSEVLSHGQMVSEAEHVNDFPFVFAGEKEGRELFFAALPATFAASVRVEAVNTEALPTRCCWLCCP